MNLTLEELKERIILSEDEVTILEVLNISATELLDRFEDKIEDKQDTLQKEYCEEIDSDE